MSDIGTLVSGIEFKVRKLTDLIKQYEAEIIKLRKSHAELLNQIEKQSEKISQLEEANLNMHLTRKAIGGEDAESVKQQINELVREVDRCIALLDK